MASKIILVGCGKMKSEAAAPACDLYVGPLFRARFEYASARGVPVFIVSAKFGLVKPGDWLPPYDLTIAELKPLDRAAWFPAVAVALLSEMTDAGFATDRQLRDVTVEVHAGADYAERLRDVLLAIGFSVACPVAGMSQGEQMAFYKSDRARPEQLRRAFV